MQFFKDKNNEPFSFEDDVTGEQLQFYINKFGLTEISEEEADALSNPPKTLTELKEDKLQELNASAEQAILDGFQYINGRYYSYDSTDQSNFSDTNIMINNALILGQQAALPLIDWNSYEDVEKTKLVREKISYDKFLELNTFAAFNHKLLILDKVGKLKEQLQNATTVEEVEGILWQ